MKFAIPDLLARFGPIVQDRQMYIAELLPQTATGGFDLDLDAGVLTLSSSSSGGESKHAIQVLGTVAEGMWLWGWANETFKKKLTRLVDTVRIWGHERELTDLANPGFPLEEGVRGAAYTGFNVAAVAAGMTKVPGIYCCDDPEHGVKVWVAFVDDKLHEPPTHPLLRIAARYPRILTQVNDGGIPIFDWCKGLESYAKELGVACEPGEGDTPETPVRVLTHETDTLVARFDAEKLSFDLAGIAR